MSRPADFDLARAVAQPSFTPSKKDAPALVALIASTDDERVVAQAQDALARIDGGAPVIAAVIDAARAAMASAGDGGAARLAAAIGVIARAQPASGASDELVRLIADASAPPRARKAAAVALGKLGGDAATAALIAYWDGELPADHRRAVAEALGKVGGDAALARLRALDPGADAELARRRDRAVLMIDRTAARTDDSEVDAGATPRAPLPMIVRCRAGLELLLADELRALGFEARRTDAGEVSLTLTRPLATLWQARIMLGAGIAVPIDRGSDRSSDRGADLATSIAGALTTDATVAALASLTEGPIRWRLDFTTGGHRRAVVWRTAQLVAARRPELINDPSATTWDVVVDEAAGRLELRPRRIADPRFAWRVRDVPAASHPTVAAALVKVAGPRADDVVWDPFVGSGAELVERGLVGPFARLIGTDLDARALEAARANLTAAGLIDRAELRVGDALEIEVATPTLIITNPPLGRRIRGDVGALLERFAIRAARMLAPGGRLVWITPVPRRTADAAQQAGLRHGARHVVDLGGFEGVLEAWHKAG